MSTFATQTLNRVVTILNRPHSFLLDAFFPQVQTSDTDLIEFHNEVKGLRMTPFVSPVKAGQVVSNEGFETQTFRPAYVKDKRQFSPRIALERQMGERIGGTLSPAQRIEAAVGRTMANQLENLTRREEWMAAQALRGGTVTVSGDGYPSKTVDFKRVGTNTKTLLTTARWGETGVKPIENVESWIGEIATAGGGAVTHIVMAPGAFRLFRADPDFKESILKDTGQSSTIQRFVNPTGGDNWAQYQGRLGTVEIWVYNQPYLDDDGAAQTMLNDMDVLLINAPGLEGARAYGVIQDEEAGFASTRYFAKSWLEKDPAIRWMLLQAAPLVIPYRPNASMRVQVR